MAKPRKTIITCAVTGAIHTPSMLEYLPVSASEIAEAAIGAAEAGAAIVHLHARDPQDGRPDQTPEAFEPFLRVIKQRSDCVVNITTGGAPESYCSEGYNSRPLLDFLLPFQQAATLCGMNWLPPFVLHSFHKLEDPEALRRCGQDYRQLLCALRDEQLTPAQLAESPYLRDLLGVLP